MSRFTYTNKQEFPRESAFDSIVHEASAKIVSAKVNAEGNMEYVVTLSDVSQNLPIPVTFSFAVNAQQRRVIRIEKMTTLVESDLLTDVKLGIIDILGNDLNELCYRVEIEDDYIGKKKEFDVLIRDSGEIDYSDLDDVSTQLEKDAP